jgi:hypothetical protein
MELGVITLALSVLAVPHNGFRTYNKYFSDSKYLILSMRYLSLLVVRLIHNYCHLFVKFLFIISSFCISNAPLSYHSTLLYSLELFVGVSPRLN